jgi:hypothetical protein
MFGFAVRDDGNRTLTLARDRLAGLLQPPDGSSRPGGTHVARSPGNPARFTRSSGKPAAASARRGPMAARRDALPRTPERHRTGARNDD